MSYQDNTVGVILAAGLGTRLRPSTDYCPKPLIPVAGIEPLYFSIHKLHSLGLKKIIVNAHYLHSMLFAALEKWKLKFPNLEIRVSNESALLLGTGGALLKIIYENEDWLQSRSLLVLNGDTLSLFDFSSILVEDKNQMAVSDNPEFLEKYGPVWLDEKHLWKGSGRQAPSPELNPAHFLGIHKLSTQAVECIPKFCGEIRPVDLFNGIYKPLVEQGFCFFGNNFSLVGKKDQCWFDITNKEFLLEAQAYILEHARELGWNLVLESRYPGVKEIQKGIWSFSNHAEETVTLKNTGVFINTSSQAIAFPKIELSRGACWIQERPLRGVAQEGSISVENAIVFIKKELNQTPPSSVVDDVILS